MKRYTQSEERRRASQLAAEIHAGSKRAGETWKEYALRRLDTMLDVDHEDVIFHLEEMIDPRSKP